jgi:hypothetical protein
MRIFVLFLLFTLIAKPFFEFFSVQLSASAFLSPAEAGQVVTDLIFLVTFAFYLFTFVFLLLSFYFCLYNICI